MSHKPFQKLLEEFSQIPASNKEDDQPSLDEIGLEDYGLIDVIDCEILKHRDTHFSGNFDFMIDYYQSEGKGVSQEFEIDRIEQLAGMEKEIGQNLAGYILDGPDSDQVKQAKEAYQKLKALLDNDDADHDDSRLMAELILSEEDDPKVEMDAIVARGPAIVPALISILSSEQLYDPLFPGYGLSPAYAAECLGKLGDERAIAPLFEAIGRGDFFHESKIISALHNLGDPAKEFLMKRLGATPVNEDNERAACALVNFKNDPKVGEAALDLLQKEEFRKPYPLNSYLALCCEGITSSRHRDLFMTIRESKELSDTLLLDMDVIAKAWQKPSSV